MEPTAASRLTTRIELATGELVNGSERALRSLYRNAALAVGMPRSIGDPPDRVDWVVRAVGRGPEAALLVGLTGSTGPFISDPTELLLGRPDERLPQTASEFEGSGILAVAFDSGVVWWAGSPADTVLAVVAAEGDVHLLAEPEKGRVHSEPLCHGDRMVALSRSITNAIDDLRSLLEMAMIDSPSAACSCLWLMDAAEEAGAIGPMFSAVWGHRDRAASAG